MPRLVVIVLVMLFASCCGARLKIVNGQLADIAEFPYMVSMQYNGTFFGHEYDHFCCGSIIDHEWIVTSAQCALARVAGEFHVRVGSAKYFEDGVVYEVAETIVHPYFNRLTFDYDVGLLKLAKKIEFGQNVQALDLPKSDESTSINEELSIAGWGATQLLDSISDDLRGSHIQKISDETCQNVYGSDSVTDRMFCVFTEGIGPCVGDSGSPAVVDNRIIGVASWSYGCAYDNPTVYAKISSVLDWIIATTTTTTQHGNEESLRRTSGSFLISRASTKE